MCFTRPTTQAVPSRFPYLWQVLAVTLDRVFLVQLLHSIKDVFISYLCYGSTKRCVVLYGSKAEQRDVRHGVADALEPAKSFCTVFNHLQQAHGHSLSVSHVNEFELSSCSNNVGLQVTDLDVVLLRRCHKGTCVKPFPVYVGQEQRHSFAGDKAFQQIQLGSHGLQVNIKWNNSQTMMMHHLKSGQKSCLWNSEKFAHSTEPGNK